MRNHKFLSDKDMGFKRIKRELANARSVVAVVGIQEGSKNPEGTSIAEYGAYNEYGTSKIPERSFMRSTFDEDLHKLRLAMAQQWAQVNRGKTVFHALSTVGLMHETAIKEKIRNLKNPPNSPRTIAYKGSDNPLIDGGHMVNSIRYIVRKA
jgi:hypothetical protein